MNIKENFAYLNYFGFTLTCSKTVNTLLKGMKGNLGWYVHDWNDTVIEKYIKGICTESYGKLCDGYYDNYGSHVKETPPFINENVSKNNVIWTIWWQGEANAPRLVKECIRSMKRHSNGHPVIVLDKDNYSDYMKLPSVIEKRFFEYYKDMTNLRKCTLDVTHISDIMRCCLLYYYGGLWCDATIMFTGDVSECLFTDEWSSLGQDDIWYIGRGKWSSFFMGATERNGLIKFIYDSFIEYWRNKKYFVHYLMMDYLFDIASKERAAFREMLDKVKSGNKKCLTVNRFYASECNKAEADIFFEMQKYHKLSWRWWGNEADTECRLYSDNGNQTWLGYLFERFIEG